MKKKYTEEEAKRWHLFGGGGWNEFHVWSPTKKIVLSYAPPYLKVHGIVYVEDTKTGKVWKMHPGKKKETK